MLEAKKVAIITTNPNFLQPILDELKERNCLVKQIQWTDDPTFNLLCVQQLMTWAEYAFFDFCHPPLPMASNFLIDCRITTRLHGLEVYSPGLKAVAWSKIHLVCSEPQHLRFRRQKLPAPASVTEVNLGTPMKPTTTPKTIYGHNIGLIAYTPLPRKRMYTTIESFCDLLSQSHDKWFLHLRGARTTGYRDAEAYEYLKFLMEFKDMLEQRGDIQPNQVVFHDFLPDDQYSNFLKNLDIIVSNSMQEGYHLSVFEAMSYGAYPLVHRWFGAELLYPKEFLFLSQRELVDKIVAWDELSPPRKRKKSLQLQRLVKKYHNQKNCINVVVDTILDEGD